MSRAAWAWVVFGVLLAFAVGYFLSKLLAAYENRSKLSGVADVLSGLEKLEVL